MWNTVELSLSDHPKYQGFFASLTGVGRLQETDHRDVVLAKGSGSPELLVQKDSVAKSF